MVLFYACLFLSFKAMSERLVQIITRHDDAHLHDWRDGGRGRCKRRLRAGKGPPPLQDLLRSQGAYPRSRGQAESAKNLVSNFSRQMPISQIATRRRASWLGIWAMCFDFDNASSAAALNLEPSTIFKLQAISISHSNRLGKVEAGYLRLDPQSGRMRRRCRASKSRYAGACRIFRRPIPGEPDERKRDEVGSP